MTTKWDLISEEERAQLARTSCGLRCTGCGEMLETEADFAQHFHLKDRTYLNLGYCPKTVAGLRGRNE